MKSMKWKNLDVKNKIAYTTAISAFTLGWALTVASFVVGKGQIHDSVLWVLGQALVYTASVFGIGMYCSTSVRQMRYDINRYMRNPSERMRDDYEDVDVKEEDIEDEQRDY